MRTSPASIALACLLTAGLSAQTSWISPKSGAANGNTNNNIPYSWWPTRYQQIFNHDSFTPAIGVMLFRGCNYRMNKSFANGRYGDQTIEIDMYLSMAPTGTTATTYSRSFSGNVDSTTTKRVIRRKRFKVPKLSNQNFDIKFPFDAGQIFIFVTGQKRALVQEVHMWGHTANTNGIFTYPMDAHRQTTPEVTRVYSYQSSSTRGSYAQNGAFNGCANNQNLIPDHHASYSITVGSSTGFVYGRSKMANAPGLLIIGATPLNITIPGTQCNLMQDLLMTFVKPSSNTIGGYTEFPIPIPNVAAFGGLTFLTQIWWVQSGNFPANLFASRGIRVTVGSAVSPDIRATATGATTGYGLIAQFN